MRGAAFVLAGLIALLALPSPALADTPEHQGAVAALQRVKDLRSGIGVRTGRELTPAFADLAKKRSFLGSRGRAQADRLMARPDGASEGSPGHTYDSNGETEATPDCGTHFCIHYVTSGVDAPAATDTTPANGIPDSIDDMLSAFENEVFACENSTSLCPDGVTTGLNWPQAPSDGVLGGDSKFDVYVEDLFPASVFGYVGPDSDNDFSTDSWHTYLVMDKDFSRYSATISGPNEMRVTAAHEYNHVLQFGIDAWEDTWMFESTATFFENVVYPSIDDYVASYMSVWANSTADPITDPDGGSSGGASGLKIYGSAVWNWWLTHQYGGATILSAWQDKNRPVVGTDASFAAGAYGDAIAGKGGTGFADEFGQFAASTAEWRVPGTYPDLYPDVERRDTLTLGAASTDEFLDHTTFMLLDAGTTTESTMTLTATLPSGLKGAIALVGRTGSDDQAGSVTTAIQQLPSGGTGIVTLGNADTFGRITAVLVNADASHTNNYDFQHFVWNYTKDNQHFTGVRVYSGPGAVTLPADGISLSGATLHGIVNPNGQTTDWHFEYGTTTTYGTSTPGAGGLTGSSDMPVADTLTGLQPNTIYHYRVVAHDALGHTSFGADQTFATTVPPTVSTDAATAIGGTGATLNGTVNPGGQATTIHFEYGRTTSYGSQTADQSAGSGQTATSLSAPISGLLPSTTYHFRIVATNGSGTISGGDVTFTTTVASTTPPTTGAGTGSTTGQTGTSGRAGALTLSITLAGGRLRALLKKGLRVRAGCNRSCTVAVRLVIAKKLARRLHLKSATVGFGEHTISGTARATVIVRFGKAARRALAKLARLKLTARGSGVDSGGSRAAQVRSLTLRR